MYPTWEDDINREWRWYHTAMLLVLIPICVLCMTIVLSVDAIRRRKQINVRVG